jgi:hypothetical protein
MCWIDAEALGELLAQRAREDVSRAAGNQGDEETDGPRGVVALRIGSAAQGAGDNE